MKMSFLIDIPADFLKRLAALCFKYPRTALLVSLIAIGIMAVKVPQVRQDVSIQAMFDDRDPQMRYFRGWQDQFATDEFIIVAWEPKGGLFTNAFKDQLIDITDKIERISHVNKVMSLSNTVSVQGVGDEIIVEPLFKDGRYSEEEWSSVKRLALEDELLKGYLLSEDGRKAAIVIEIDDTYKEGSKYREDIIKKIESIMKGHNIEPFYITGRVAIDYWVSRFMNEDIQKFLPIVFLFILLLFLILFRHWVIMLAGMLVCSAGLVGAYFGLFMINGSMNLITSILPPVIVALAVADSVHMFSEYLQHRRQSDKKEAFRNTIKSTARPCFLTSFTTIIGFLSLQTVDIPSMRQLGFAASFGILIALIFSFLIIPSAIGLFDINPAAVKESKGSRHNEVLPFFAKGVLKYRWVFILLSFVAIVFSVFQIKNITTQTNVLEYLDKSTDIYKATLYYEGGFTGTCVLNLSIRAGSQGEFQKAHVLSRIDNFISQIEKKNGVDKVLSINNFIKRMNYAMHGNDWAFYKIPKDDNLISQYFLLYDYKDIKRFINPTKDWINIQVMSSEHNSKKLKELMSWLQSKMEKELPEYASNITGYIAMDVFLIDNIVYSQIKSLSLAMVLIIITMAVTFGSIKIGLLSMVPNVFPLFCLFGLMGAAGISLTTDTAMISAIAIGIIVDDTIHFLSEFFVRFQTIDIRSALETAIIYKGRGIITTSLILVLGFAVLLVSHFGPTRNFGILTTFVIAMALWGDLALLPSVLTFMKQRSFVPNPTDISAQN